MKKKYNVRVLFVHETYANIQLSELQNEGWEIAGNINITNTQGDCNSNYLAIPLKKLIE